MASLAARLEVAADLARRDGLDHHVLHPAADAVVLTTDELSPAEEVEWVLDYLHTKCGGCDNVQFVDRHVCPAVARNNRVVCRLC
ncbi:hypothetical protein HC891_09430 [Candidatus Gracilibacteria bacterium]|nr:hypothetical protein [Candidatus Gracilibacteria bacterium]